MDKIEIYTSKSGSMASLIGTFLFLAVGLFLIIVGPLPIKLLGLITIAFFGYVAYISIRRISKSELVIVIAERGLSLNPVREPDKYIEWKDITGFREISIRGQRFLVIKVADAKYWVQRESNLFRRMLIRYNVLMHGSPFNIASTGLEMTYPEIRLKLEAFHEAYKNA